MPHSFEELAHGAYVLGSAPLDDDPFDNEFVLYWSTRLSAAEFVSKCDHLIHAPGNLHNIEIIADSEYLRTDEADLERKLSGRSIVRFNAADWSVTWLAGSPSQPNEIQACVSSLPKVMRSMVIGSIEGFSEFEVEQVLHGLQAA